MWSKACEDGEIWDQPRVLGLVWVGKGVLTAAQWGQKKEKKAHSGSGCLFFFFFFRGFLVAAAALPTSHAAGCFPQC